MKLGKSLSALAAAGLVFAPIVAQAGTRAADTSVSLAPLADMAPRQGSPIGASEEALSPHLVWLLYLIFGAAAAAIIIAIEQSENDASPGTGG